MGHIRNCVSESNPLSVTPSNWHPWVIHAWAGLLFMTVRQIESNAGKFLNCDGDWRTIKSVCHSDHPSLWHLWTSKINRGCVAEVIYCKRRKVNFLSGIQLWTAGGAHTQRIAGCMCVVGWKEGIKQTGGESFYDKNRSKRKLNCGVKTSLSLESPTL